MIKNEYRQFTGKNQQHKGNEMNFMKKKHHGRIQVKKKYKLIIIAITKIK